MMLKNRNNSTSQLDEFYAPLFLGDRLIMHDICNALGLSSAKKDEFIKDYYKNDENKLIMWAKRIKRKCPKFFDTFIELAELDDDLVNENFNMKGKRNTIVKEANSYGWVVEDYDAYEAYQFACDNFGKEYVDDQIIDTLSTEELASSLAYLFRMWDFEDWNEYKE